jgi:hypothetical protein
MPGWLSSAGSGCCRVADVFRCSGSPSQRNSDRPHCLWRGDEAPQLAAAERGVRRAVRCRNAQLAASGGSKPVNPGGSQNNRRQEWRQLPELGLPELASGCEPVALPSVLVRSHRCSRTSPRAHGSINQNEKEEEPHGIDPAETGLRRRQDHPQSYHTFGFSLDSPCL